MGGRGGQPNNNKKTMNKPNDQRDPVAYGRYQYEEDYLIMPLSIRLSLR